LGAGCEDLPPEIETYWDRYVDTSHVRRCAVFPLCPGGDQRPAFGGDSPFGALVFEQILDGQHEPQQQSRVAQLARYSTSAIQNALQHERIFLLPVWRAVGGLLGAIGGRHFSKTVLLGILTIVVVFVLTTRETGFTVPVRGHLQPSVRRTVFARESGVVLDVLVEHGQMVEAGQALLRMRSTDLDVEIAGLVGKRIATREQILALQRALLDEGRLAAAEQNRLSGDLLRLQHLATSIDCQIELVRRKEQHLVVRADRAGQIVTWHVRDKLLHRPIQKGQALMAVVDPESDWELDLYVPERHVGHLLQAAGQQMEPLPVTFALASHAGESFEGRLVEIDEVAVARDEHGSSVRLRASIDKRQLSELRCDATVIAKVHCGQRSLGYTWFHDLIDTVQAKVLFWL
jgi:hypothetical protein